MKARYNAKKLHVRLSGKEILHGLDFEARSGELTAIIGPNGSGKTTLMRALSNDIAWTGEILINGAELKRLPAAELAARRAVLPQMSVLSFPFTVHEVVELGLRAGVAGAEVARGRNLVGEALEKVDLNGFGGRIYQELSGGEQQRVQLARVLCQIWAQADDGEPKWLLLDEPVSSLDIRHQLAIMDAAREHAGKGGVIAVMHDLNLTAMYADRVYVLDGGRVVASGSPRQVLTAQTLSEVFGCALKVDAVPGDDVPFFLPQAAGGVGAVVPR